MQIKLWPANEKSVLAIVNQTPDSQRILSPTKVANLAIASYMVTRANQQGPSKAKKGKSK